VGADALGVIREISRVSSSAAGPLRRLHKQICDAIVGEAGNYRPAYACEFERAINRDGDAAIPVRLFHWSSENHHIGRADGAVRLIDELASGEWREGRVLVWAHSHGGNVLALLTNLLASDPATNGRFFRASRSYFRWPISEATDMPAWQRVWRMLRRDDHPLTRVSLDLVTLGTPVRYGWDSSGYDKLLHFVNHRPIRGGSPHRATFPPSIEDLLTAAGGDYVQQLGIAGTNLAPPFWAWRAWLADIRLGRILQAGLGRRDTLVRLKLGTRVHQEGETLLVDYGPARGHVGQHLLGHAIYTRQDWLLFHAEQVASRFYGLATANEHPRALGET
jgi:hypothetical protein